MIFGVCFDDFLLRDSNVLTLSYFMICEIQVANFHFFFVSNMFSTIKL